MDFLGAASQQELVLNSHPYSVTSPPPPSPAPVMDELSSLSPDSIGLLFQSDGSFHLQCPPASLRVITATIRHQPPGGDQLTAYPLSSPKCPEHAAADLVMQLENPSATCCLGCPGATCTHGHSHVQTWNSLWTNCGLHRSPITEHCF